MSYQILSPQNRVNKYVNELAQQQGTGQPQGRQRSNSSGKKIVIIRRKLSNPSSINSNNDISNIQQQTNVQRRQQYMQHSHGNQTNLRQVQPQYKKFSQNNSSTITLNPQATRSTLQDNQTTYMPHYKQKCTQSSLSISRGESYEQQLDKIQEDVQFFSRRLQQAEQKNRQQQNMSRRKQLELSQTIKNVYFFIHRLFNSQIQTISQMLDNFMHPEDKFQFMHVVQKSSGFNNMSPSLKQFEKDMQTLAKTLNLTVLSRNHFDQIVKSQQIALELNMKQIDQLKQQNRTITSEYRKLQKIVHEKARIKLVTKEVQTLADKKLVTREVQTLAPKTVQKPLEESKKTTDRSRQQSLIQKKHAQTQTEQKRIGSAGSIHKYQPYRFQNIPNRSSPYRNYIRDRSVSNGSQGSNSLGATLKRQVEIAQTAKKVNVQRPINTNKLQPSKQTQKKKMPATSSYLNHLIQSENYIEESKQLAGQLPTARSNRFEKHLENSKSQLSVRRPPHRSRSQSHQEVPSSRQRVNSKNSTSFNNTSSRVVSTYSLNPVNQYGEKRLCNQINGKRVRKATQLSQDSENLSERMKELMEEEEMLKQKYRELQQMKVSRETKKSRLNKSIQSKKQPA